jgi:hypothetical protein
MTRVLYPGDLRARVKCWLVGHRWFGDETGRHCCHCWRVEEGER